MRLKRLSIDPNAAYLARQAIRTFSSWIPSDFGWFTRAAIDVGELSKHVRAWASLLATWRKELESIRYNFLLGTAVEEGLDTIGRFLKTPRLKDETDDSYARRIHARILQARITPKAFTDLVGEITEGAVNSELIEPWKDVKLRGDMHSRSGRGRRPDRRYFRGATFDIVIDDFVTSLEGEIAERKAYGTAGYQTLRQHGKYSLNDDAKAAQVDGFGRSNAVTSDHHIRVEAQCDMGGTVAAAFELVVRQDSFVGPDRTLTGVEPIQPENLARNYALSIDMLTSAATGHPVHTVVSGPLAAGDPTDIQPGVEVLQEP